MAIAGLFDSWMKIWRPTESKGAYRQAEDTYAPVTVPTGPNACLDYTPGALVNEAAGEKDVGRRLWYLDRACDVRERDVLEVLAGPRTGSRWRVDGEPDKPSGGPRNAGVFHHWEVVTVPWKGKLPTDEDS